MNNRRKFLQNISLITASGLLASNSKLVQASNHSIVSTASGKKELGLQIYSLQNELYDNIPKRMNELKAMGYSKLELAGYNKGRIVNMNMKEMKVVADIDMVEFKKMADDAGLKIVSSHANPSIEGAPFLLDYSKDILPQVKEYWKAAAADHAKIGCKYLIQPMMPNVSTHSDADLICEFLNEAGRICKEEGLIFGYHNHNFEFKRIVKPEDAAKKTMPWEVKGDQIQDLFIAGTDPLLVTFEFDVYWTVRGGNDPLEYLKKYPERIKALHIKDTSILGQSGLLNFPNIFNQMYLNGIQDFFVELEKMPDARTQFDGVKACADYLQHAAFVK